MNYSSVCCIPWVVESKVGTFLREFFFPKYNITYSMMFSLRFSTWAFVRNSGSVVKATIEWEYPSWGVECCKPDLLLWDLG